MGVNSMSTWQILGRLSGRKHILPTYWTIVLVLVLETIVRKENIDRNAHAAFFTMAEGLSASHTTKTALVAMERFL